MRTSTLVVAALLLSAATILVAPEASACDSHIPGLCVKCVYGSDRGCVVHELCITEGTCDPVWP